jgi:hypothetical protein
MQMRRRSGWVALAVLAAVGGAGRGAAAADEAVPAEKRARSEGPSPTLPIAPKKPNEASGFRLEGSAEVEVVFGDVNLYRAHVDAFYDLEKQMGTQREAAARNIQAALRALKRSKGRSCPSRAVAPLWLAADQAATAYRAVGGRFEDEYLAIIQLDELEETTGLTPDYRWRVNQVRRRYKDALVDFRELRAAMKEQLAGELAYRQCKPAELVALATAPRKPGEPSLGADAEAEEAPRPEPPAPKPPEPQSAGETVTFFVDNRTCKQSVSVYVDGELRGEVAASSRTALQSQAGRRAMCLIPSTSRATCGDRGTVRTAYLHDGWSITMNCL